MYYFSFKCVRVVVSADAFFRNDSHHLKIIQERDRSHLGTNISESGRILLYGGILTK